MHKDSNKATFLFSSGMVVVIAILLSVAAISLAPYQAKNVRIEKMKNILTSVAVDASSKEAETLFAKYITGQVVLNNKGEEVSGDAVAFDIDLKKEMDKAKTGKQNEQLFPLLLFVIKMENLFISFRLGEKDCGAPSGVIFRWKLI